MAYQFSAEKRGDQDLALVHEKLARYRLIEFFPVEIGDEVLTLGVSIPFKFMDDPAFESELVDLMTFLVSEKGFQVTDLFTGNLVRADEIPELPKRISG